jgi:hypothetical protein
MTDVMQYGHAYARLGTPHVYAQSILINCNETYSRILNACVCNIEMRVTMFIEVKDSNDTTIFDMNDFNVYAHIESNDER